MALYCERLLYTNIIYLLLLLLVKYFKCRKHTPTHDTFFILNLTTHQKLYKL